MSPSARKRQASKVHIPWKAKIQEAPARALSGREAEAVARITVVVQLKGQGAEGPSSVAEERPVDPRSATW
eukprot:747642-Hanusia_phi.AAC.7